MRTLGEVRLRQGNLTEAEQLIHQSLTMAQTNQNRIFEAYAWRALSTAQLARANLPVAQESLAQADQILRKQGLAAEIEE